MTIGRIPVLGALAVASVAACAAPIPGGADGAGGAGGATTDPPAAACAGPIDPGPTPLRRLTPIEYRNTVRDLLGDGPDRTIGFPEDPVQGGFDNNAEAITISDAHVEKYRDAAERIAADVVRDPSRRAKAIGCDLTGADRAGCLSRFIAAFGRRVYRRPLSPEEIAAFERLAATAAGDADRWAAAALVIQGALQSPLFLFRVEEGTPAGALVKLTGFEVATRLSYFILGTTPDDALLDAAAAGRLDEAAGVAAEAGRLLADPRARGAFRTFFGNWLTITHLTDVERDPELFPAWSKALASSMQEEAMRLMEEHAWQDGRDFLGVFTARHTFIDATLARFYGVPAPTGWARHEFAPGAARSGLLTQPGVLTVTGKNESGLPIFRGRFVREQLLCETPPPAPPAVPTIPAPRAGESDRERLDRHRRDPACGGCHSLLDPLGFALQGYDLIGRPRQADSAGQPIDTRGSFTGFDTVDFDGPEELGQALAARPGVGACLATHMFRYASGRVETAVDDCRRKALADAFAASGHDLRALILTVASGDGFRFRRPAATEM